MARTHDRLLAPAAIRHRLRILGGVFLDHQFERSSPIAALPDEVLDHIYSQEVVLPPRKFLSQPGTQPTEGLIFLASLAKTLSVATAFEIGTYTGLTTWCLARNLSGTTVHTLDIPEGATRELPLERSDVHRASSTTPMTYELLAHDAKVIQHWGDSATFDFSPWFGTCDLVYVDGAHSEPYVRRDTENALELLTPGGAIVWDDYWRMSPGVTRTLNSRTDLDLYRIPGTRLVAYFGRSVRRELSMEVVDRIRCPHAGEP